MVPEPIVHEYALPCSPGHAFDVYVDRIGEWWHSGYSANPATLQTVTIEPYVGGRVVAKHSLEGELTWGVVTVWEPGRRLAHTFTLAQPPDRPSAVTVRFEPAASGCLVRFEHGGWDEGNASVRDKFGDWPIMLDRFAALIATPA